MTDQTPSWQAKVLQSWAMPIPCIWVHTSAFKAIYSTSGRLASIHARPVLISCIRQQMQNSSDVFPLEAASKDWKILLEPFPTLKILCGFSESLKIKIAYFALSIEDAGYLQPFWFWSPKLGRLQLQVQSEQGQVWYTACLVGTTLANRCNRHGACLFEHWMLNTHQRAHTCAKHWSTIQSLQFTGLNQKQTCRINNSLGMELCTCRLHACGSWMVAQMIVLQQFWNPTNADALLNYAI